MAALRRLGSTPPLPEPVDYSKGMPSNLGFMLNDTLGDCTAAACGHAMQVWSFNAQPPMITPSDDEIEKLYEATGGYVPGNPNTDNGAVEQVVLQYWLNNPLDNNQLAAFVEVDVKDRSEIKRAIWECGVVYIGFNVPAYLQTLEAPGSNWATNANADNAIIGGHAVAVVGWDARDNFVLISWGAGYTMTPSFWYAFVDEAYALANPAWMEKTGRSPAGLSLERLKSFMSSMMTIIPKPVEHRHHRRKKRWGGDA
jgi:hypothetical protein